MSELIDYVARAIPLLKARDENSWSLGDLVAEAVQDLEICVGRPADPEQLTLSDFAGQLDVAKQRVSAWLTNARFYPPSVRLLDISWAHHDLARRASENDRALALQYLAAARSQHLGIAAFRRYLRGDYYEGMVERHEIAPRLQAVLPPGEHYLWITMRRYEDGDG